MSTTYRVNRFEFRKDTLLWGALIVNTHLLMILAYYALSPNRFTGLTVVIPPVVWIAVSIWVFARTDPPAGTQRQRTIALAVATAYFGLLAYFGGLWGAGAPGPVSTQLTVFSLPPGWNPILKIQTSLVEIVLIPYQFVGYLALAYLIYTAILEAAGSAISGVLGLLSCVSCTWPIIATVATSVVGGTAGITGFVYSQSYLLSTVVFVVTVVLLYWRPGWR